jgi:hypothetical protein
MIVLAVAGGVGLHLSRPKRILASVLVVDVHVHASCNPRCFCATVVATADLVATDVFFNIVCLSYSVWSLGDGFETAMQCLRVSAGVSTVSCKCDRKCCKLEGGHERQ